MAVSHRLPYLTLVIGKTSPLRLCFFCLKVEMWACMGMNTGVSLSSAACEGATQESHLWLSTQSGKLSSGNTFKTDFLMDSNRFLSGSTSDNCKGGFPIFVTYLDFSCFILRNCFQEFFHALLQIYIFILSHKMRVWIFDLDHVCFTDVTVDKWLKSNNSFKLTLAGTYRSWVTEAGGLLWVQR